MNLFKHSVLVAAVLGLCASGATRAQPTFQSASPTAGTATSEKANANADKAMYQVKESGKNGIQIAPAPADS